MHTSLLRLSAAYQHLRDPLHFIPLVRRVQSSPTDKTFRKMASTTEPQQPLSDPKAPKVSAPPSDSHSHTHSHSRFGTLLSRSLPSYTGTYPVGVLDVELPIERQVIGSFRLKKGLKKEEVGLELETVLFSLHYPCRVEPGKRKGTQWFPR